MPIDTRITLRKLEVLSLVAQLGNYSRAAEHLFVGQPVVTTHIRSLEERLGATLFYRDGREMRLTDAGLVVSAWAEEVLRRTRELDRDLASMSDGTQGSVSMGASMSVGSYRLPAVLSAFRDAHPMSDLRMSIFDTEHAIEDTRNGTLDFCVVVMDAQADIPGMAAEVLGLDEMVLVCAPGALAGARIGLEQLARLPFIDVPSGTVRRTFVDRQLQRLGVPERNVVLQLGHPEAMKRAARKGLGVSLMFRTAVEDELANGVLEEIEIDGVRLRVPIVLVSRRGKTFSPLHSKLIQAIRRELATP